MTTKFFVGANWKMNLPPAGYDTQDSAFRSTSTIEVVVFPSCTDIHATVHAGLTTGGQCGRSEECGPYTGDISMKQLKLAGCSHVLCGHSERRFHHEENDTCIAHQVHSALKEGLVAVLCIGENSDQRELGTTNDVLKNQLDPVLKLVKTIATPENFIVAYEPVWAIGTGNTPAPQEVEITHAYIRSLLPDPAVRIIYGGSLNAENSASFFELENVNGGLIGGASLKPDEFRTIIETAEQ